MQFAPNSTLGFPDGISAQGSRQNGSPETKSAPVALDTLREVSHGRGVPLTYPPRGTASPVSIFATE
jgi:hypothetical protein